jgi:hypothetical protein
MPYNSPEALDAYRANPDVFAINWKDTNVTTRQNLGAVLTKEAGKVPIFWDGMCDDGWLAAYAAFTAYDLAEYGCPGKSYQYFPLEDMIKWTKMACNDYCEITRRLFRRVRPKSDAKIRWVGWAGKDNEGKIQEGIVPPTSLSPFGNHAQLLITFDKRKVGLLLDPTIGAVAMVDFPRFLDGDPALFYKRVGGWRDGDKNGPACAVLAAAVESALVDGHQLQRSQLLYYNDENQNKMDVGT